MDAEETHALPAAIPIPDRAVAVAVGDLTGSGGDQIYIGTDTTVTRLDGEGWASPTDIWSQPDDVGAVPLIADLTGDGVPDLLVGLPDSDRRVGQVLVFEGPVIDPVTWETPHLELKGFLDPDDPHPAGPLTGSAIWAVDADGDGGLDLVVKASERTWIRPGPLTTSEPLGADGDIEWADSVDAKQQQTAVGDIDGDSVPDLVFLVGPVDGACGAPTYTVLAAVGPFGPGSSTLDEATIRLTPPADAASLDRIDLADVTGDGLLDLVAGAPAGALVWPAPLMDGAPPAATVVSPFGAVGFGDFDGDSTLDLLELNLISPSTAGPFDTAAEAVVSVTDGPLASWADRETCEVPVTVAWTGWPIAFQDAAWVGDLDGDGLADAILATGTQVEILSSTAR